MREVRFFLFRHGETDWNAEGRFQGHLDIPLNDRGRVQAMELGRKLRNEGLELIVASDLSRAIETAEIVAQEIGLNPAEVIREPGLKEAFLGEAQGLTLNEIRSAFGPEVLQRWRSNDLSDADVSYPGGESGAQVLERSLRAIQALAARYPDATRVGLATHGGVIRRFMHEVLRLAGKPPQRPIAIPNGVVYCVSYRPDSASWRF